MIPTSPVCLTTCQDYRKSGNVLALYTDYIIHYGLPCFLCGYIIHYGFTLFFVWLHYSLWLYLVFCVVTLFTMVLPCFLCGYIIHYGYTLFFV